MYFMHTLYPDVELAKYTLMYISQNIQLCDHLLICLSSKLHFQIMFLALTCAVLESREKHGYPLQTSKKKHMVLIHTK